MICKKCQTRLAPSFNFCPECGTKADHSPVKITCRVCGEQCNARGIAGHYRMKHGLNYQEAHFSIEKPKQKAKSE